MIQNLLYLSPEFPRNYVQFILQLRHRGVQVLGISGTRLEDLPSDVRGGLVDYVQVPDLKDYRAVVDAARGLERRHGAIDRVESHCEHWLPLEAALREELGAPGLDRCRTAFLRKKSSMKEIFGQAGVPVARGRVARGLAEAQAFAAKVGYPLVLKPDIGVGAAGTYRADGPERLAEFFRGLAASPTFVEEFIAGDICTFDGLVDRDGQIVYCNSLTYSQGVMEVVNRDEHVFYYTAREIPADLEGAGRLVVQAAGIRERFFHIEFFRTRTDRRIVGLEINIRAPGGFTTDMWNYADDIDLYRGWARIVTGGSLGFEWCRRNHVLFVGRKDHIPYAHAHEDVLARFRALLCHWDRLPDLFARAMGNTGYLLRSDSLEELLQAAAYVHAAPVLAISGSRD